MGAATLRTHPLRESARLSAAFLAIINGRIDPICGAGIMAQFLLSV